MKEFKNIKLGIGSIVISILALTGVCSAVPIVMDAISACKLAAEENYTTTRRQIDSRYEVSVDACVVEYYQALRGIYPMPAPCDANMGDPGLYLCLDEHLPANGPARDQYNRIDGVYRGCIGRAAATRDEAHLTALENFKKAQKACDNLKDATAPVVEN